MELCGCISFFATEKIKMIEIKNLKKKYPNSDRYAVNNLSVTLKEGEIFGFLGQNGAGKSTTIKCLTGILPFDEGEITVCGHSIKDDPIGAKMNMGYVPDNHSVYEKLTGREYVNYVADLYHVSLEDRTARLEKFLDLFRLRFAVDKQIKGYSHGMKQKINVIGALIHNPKLLVLDEPFTGLDPQSAFQLKTMMRKHAENGGAVLFSSHVLDVVEKICDRVGIIDHGKIIAVGSVEAIRESADDSLEKFFLQITGEAEKEA